MKKQTSNSESQRKKCSRCKTEKPLSEFYHHKVDKYHPMGFQHYCKTCKNEVSKQYQMETFEGSYLRHKNHSKERGLGCSVCTVPYVITEGEIDFHHITDDTVVPIPRHIHKKYYGLKNHREYVLIELHNLYKPYPKKYFKKVMDLLT